MYVLPKSPPNLFILFSTYSFLISTLKGNALIIKPFILRSAQTLNLLTAQPAHQTLPGRNLDTSTFKMFFSVFCYRTAH